MVNFQNNIGSRDCAREKKNIKTWNKVSRAFLVYLKTISHIVSRFVSKQAKSSWNRYLHFSFFSLHESNDNKCIYPLNYMAVGGKEKLLFRTKQIINLFIEPKTRSRLLIKLINYSG